MAEFVFLSEKNRERYLRVISPAGKLMARLGVSCEVGLMQRPERIALLIIGSLVASIPVIGPFIMKLTLLLLAGLSNFTALHRMIYIKKELL